VDNNTIKLFGSKKTDNWQTPILLFHKLDMEFNFDFDPCPLNPTFDGLQVDWKESNFINPPYSKVKEFLIKGKEEMDKGNAKTNVFLTFANTDTKWFHELVLGKARIRFIRGRLKFQDENGNIQNSAMRPSMILIFKPRKETYSRIKKYLDKHNQQ
jgi:site-specific DNA-methyltransferase (adenine-specific)